jgi:hypothetical protein
MIAFNVFRVEIGIVEYDKGRILPSSREATWMSLFMSRRPTSVEPVKVICTSGLEAFAQSPLLRWSAR